MKVLLDGKVEVEMSDEVADRLLAWLQVETDFTGSLVELEAMVLDLPKKAKK